MALTARELMTVLQDVHPDTPVVVDVNTDEGVYLRVDEIGVTTDEGDGPSGIELVIWWEPQDGWLQRLVSSTNDVRRQLGRQPFRFDDAS
jgi:hypothetical protein